MHPAVLNNKVRISLFLYFSVSVYKKMSDKSDNQFWIRLQGSTIKIFLKNGFKYEGTLEAVCQDFLDVLDFKLQKSKIVRIDDVQDVEVLS